VETALEETKKAVQSGNLDEIRASKDKLTQASHKLAEAMYRQAGPQGGPNGAGATEGAAGAEKPKDNVVDAEFVDVDDKK
jgi:molecular chaperone DnaK